MRLLALSVIFVLVQTSTHATNEPAVPGSPDYLDTRNGALGFTFGQSTNGIDHLSLLSDEGRVVRYQVQKFRETVGDVTFTRCWLEFLDGKLYGISLETDNAKRLMRLMEDVYGPSDDGSHWRGKKVIAGISRHDPPTATFLDKAGMFEVEKLLQASRRAAAGKM